MEKSFMQVEFELIRNLADAGVEYTQALSRDAISPEYFDKQTETIFKALSDLLENAKEEED